MASTSASGPSQSHLPAWPPEPIPPVGYLSRKALPIKRNDAEPLTREDVQFDLLNYIFSDTHASFASTTPGKTAKIPFRELYINALYSSSKCSKVLKDKMIDTPAFALELAKISLLTNVGRINTTMAFFPEMKTALRTYHPVPSLQKTDGNAQDAPRIKNCLKAALLPSELKTIPPSTPEEILSKSQAGQKPPTSVVNLIFVLANHAAPLAGVHFDGTLNFLDLFLPKKGLISADRARVFLWLIYHYLEDSEGPNPWDDDYSTAKRPKAPRMRVMSDVEQDLENVDTPDEIEWGRKMSAQRNLFLQRLVSSMDHEKKSRNPALPHFVPAAPETNASRSRSNRPGHEVPKDDLGFMYYVPGPNRDRELPPSSTRHQSPGKEDSRNLLTTLRKESKISVDLVPILVPSDHRRHSGPRQHGEERSMLQQAWHVVNSVDPLLDSDEEVVDDNARQDYSRRLNVITRLLNNPTTPTYQQPQTYQQQQRTQAHHPLLHRSHSHPHHTSNPRYPHNYVTRHEQQQQEHRGQRGDELSAPSLMVRSSNSSNNSSGPAPASSTSSASSVRNIIRLPRSSASRK